MFIKKSKKTSRIKNQVKENDLLNKNKSKYHTTSSTNDTFLIQPYTTPLNKKEEKNSTKTNIWRSYSRKRIKPSPNCESKCKLHWSLAI